MDFRFFVQRGGKDCVLNLVLDGIVVHTGRTETDGVESIERELPRAINHYFCEKRNHFQGQTIPITASSEDYPGFLCRTEVEVGKNRVHGDYTFEYNRE